ncbi:UTP--glucose-1-phosphate uridylyltransferase [Neobacillus sp. SuZ13]|uniref:UTP--glucose-1-phosphate uridylyltransferase n=1 Tax=Neobacillus sp. SuZ13 TaxID=3047875 RepID=UPI0024C0812D|nr:UTP--glucose-1-phosphate uridylyltransferase [Neobacillus sp. SuZ13]WHY69803.1 UTP--glucose-1-phosphate uridylyltransferase [Neobacillus sp. SuZ13]
MVRKAIIPAAGYGIRSLPITKVIPKEMFPVGLKPVIHYIVEEAFSSGIEQILIITSKSRDLIMDYFDSSIELEAFLKSKNKEHLIKKLEIPKVEILYKRQAVANGLGDAIRLGKEFVGNEPFAVLLPDDIVIPEPVPALKELIEVHKETKGSVIGLKQIKQDCLKDYGVIQGWPKERFIEIQDIVEKPETNAPSDLAVIGRYIFTPKLFTYLELTNEGVGGELQLTDAIKSLLANESVFGKIISGDRYDIGKLKEYVELVNRLIKTD